MHQVSDETQIFDGARVKALIEDKSVIAAFAALDKRYWDGFKTCKTPEEKNALGAKASALEDLKNELQGIVDTGICATVRNERKARR
jgi:hypothetical protein